MTPLIQSEREKLGIRIRATLVMNGLWASDGQGETAVNAIATLILSEKAEARRIAKLENARGESC